MIRFLLWSLYLLPWQRKNIYSITLLLAKKIPAIVAGIFFMRQQPFANKWLSDRGTFIERRAVIKPEVWSLSRVEVIIQCSHLSRLFPPTSAHGTLNSLSAINEETGVVPVSSLNHLSANKPGIILQNYAA